VVEGGCVVCRCGGHIVFEVLAICLFEGEEEMEEVVECLFGVN